jgi:hypothetical protein
MKKNIKLSFVLFFLVSVLCISFTQAGIGIKWNQESLMIDEGQRACLSYGVYNPWGEDTGATIVLGGSIKEVLVMQELEAKLITAHTSSDDSIPIEFCFKVPKVYHRDCAVANTFLCELKCEEEMKAYTGEVIVQSAPLLAATVGTAGSATVMSVSAPLNVRVRCNPHPRDYTLLYVLIGAIAALIVIILLVKKYRKPKVERDKEKLKKLRAEIAKEAGKRKPKKKSSRKKKK